MSVAGQCEICGSGPVEDGCDRCGRLVCIDHYDDASGLCSSCLSEFGEEPSGGGEGEYPDGVDEYRF